MTRKTSATPGLESRAADFRRELLSWYKVNRRRLPWREDPSAYGTVVSEFMLQQTQVATVLPYFDRWMRELPGFEALAAAGEDRVMRLWEGLGYYRRARNLHRLAREVVRRGSPPADAAGWLEMPGIGPYTSAAVASIAFGEAVACVDGNVVRILARLTRDGAPARDGTAAAKRLAPLAQALVDPDEPGDHNQAMMELGATVCTKAAPRCGSCPVSGFCAAKAAGDPLSYPRLRRVAQVQARVERVWCVRGGRLLLHRNPGGARRLAGIHELPSAEQAGVPPGAGRLLARRQRAITRFRVTESIREAPPSMRPAGQGLVWVAISDLGSVTLSGPHRRWIQELLRVREKG